MSISLTEKAPSHVFFCIFLFRDKGLSIYKISKLVYGTEKAIGRVFDTLKKLESEGLILSSEKTYKKRKSKMIVPNLKKLVDVFNEYAELGFTEEEKEIFLKNLEKADPWIFVFPYTKENISEFLITTNNFIEFFTLWHKGMTKILFSNANINKEEDLEKFKKDSKLLDVIVEKSQIPLLKEVFTYLLALPYSILKKLENAKLKEGESNVFFGLLITFGSLIPQLTIEFFKTGEEIKKELKSKT